MVIEGLLRAVPSSKEEEFQEILVGKGWINETQINIKY